MRTTTLAVLLAVLPSPLPVRTCAADDPVTVQPKPLPAASAITAVTLYQGRAQVTRSASPTLEPGVWEIRFAGLPAATVAESLQSSVGSPAKLLDVRFESRVLPEDASTQPERKEIESALHRLRDEIAAAAAERETLLGSIQILDALAPRVAQSTGKDLGSGGFDPERVRAQLAALAQERDLASRAIIAIDEANRKRDDERAALAARAASLGGGGTVERTGIAVVAMTGDTTTVPIDLLYQTGEATWTPTYSLRAASDLSGLAVDYEAAIRQQTGEAWDNVKLTLSTATPTRPAGPPPIEPVYVQAFEMKPAAGRIMSVEAAAPPPPPPLPPGEAEAPAKADWAMNARRAADDAAVTQNATAATYVLPRTVSLPSDSRREQKTRIASIDLKPDYSYVTRPAADPAVFLRGKTRNDSPYQLLAGKASVFLGGDSIGQVDLPDVAPGADVELWFGADKRLAAQRVLVAKNASTSGLFSKSADTAWQYRIDLTSTLDKPANVEVWDRIPVSQDERVVVTLSDVLPPLAKDNAYEAGERKQGLLKWLVKLPPRGADRQPEVVPVRWNVKLAHPVDIATTPVPD